MKRVGFVTSAQFPHLTDSDSLVIEPLRKRGIEVEPIIWSSPPATLNQFEAIIMRSAWDYHTNISKFKLFLNSINKSGVPTYNPIDTMTWNINKSYLLDLSKQGVPIVPSIKIQTFNENILTHINKWSEIIIKPTVGGSAYGIKKLQTANKKEIMREINNLLFIGDVLIQPFMKEIYDGEISFIFFDKQYSHAVLKIPRVNEYRTQPQFGVTCRRVYPESRLINQANEIIHHIKEPLLYARLDALVVNNNLLLMELELIEPHLFLDEAPEAASTFADAIARSI